MGGELGHPWRDRTEGDPHHHRIHLGSRVKLAGAHLHDGFHRGAISEQDGEHPVFLGAHLGGNPLAHLFLQHEHGPVQGFVVFDELEKKQVGDRVGKVGQDFQRAIGLGRKRGEVGLEKILVDEGDVGGQILVLLVVGNDSGIKLQADDLLDPFGQGQGQGT